MRTATTQTTEVVVDVRPAIGKLPGDALAMRGIPVLARGVTGAIARTRPDKVDFDRR
jgi:hypothetical protein